MWKGITQNHFPDLASGATAMFMHPEQPELLLYSADFHGTLIRSTDGGDTWENILFADGTVSAFAMNPLNSNQIVGTISRLGLLVSDDRGEEWRVEEISDTPVRYRDLIFVNEKLYIASEGAVLQTEDMQTFTQFNEGIDFGHTEAGHALTLPRTLSVDIHQQNLYLGHEYVPIGDEKIGGIYVRKLDN